MKPAIVLAALMGVPIAASAALPPQYQRQRELVSIIQSAEVEEALDGQPIDSVSMTGDDRYTVTAGLCSVEVEIVDKKRVMAPGWAGPRQFELRVGDADCAQEDSD